MRIRATHLLLPLLLMAGSSLEAGDEVDDDLLTVAERSGYEATSREVEVLELIERLDERARHVRRFTFGKTVEGRPLVAVVAGRPPRQPRPKDRKDDRITALLLGNIHPGECAAKEALLMLLREIALDPKHPWLERLVLIFVPNYNADGNERMDKKNRPGQIGPSEGMGVRPNAQGFDLNREFVKLESPEARGLITLINRWNPHLFIDGHTTNGSKHRYDLTYDVTHNPAAHPGMISFLREEMLPEITKRLEAEGTPTFYYGNFDKKHTRWFTFGHQARYSTEYVGLRGRLAILSEAYSYIPYKDRIFATKAFVTACLDYVSSRHVHVRRLLEKAAAHRPKTVPLRSRIAPFEKPFVVRGYDLPDAPEKEKDHEVRFFGRYEPTLEVSRPLAYVIPPELAAIVENLKHHGIRARRLDGPRKATVQVYRIDEVKRREKAFQKHHMAQAEVTARTEERTLPEGAWWIPTDQPLGTLAAYLLEPASDDGLVNWNFFDAHLEPGKDFPVLRVIKPR